jgi:hypothetical protein
MWDHTKESETTSVISVERLCQLVFLFRHTEELTPGRNRLCAMFVVKLSILPIIWMFTSALTLVQSLILAKSVARALHSVHHCQYTSATTQGSGHTNVCCVARHLLQRHCWTLISRTMTESFRVECSYLFWKYYQYLLPHLGNCVVTGSRRFVTVTNIFG